MAYEMDTLDVSFIASGSLAALQYTFVEMSADNTVQAYSSGPAIGVLQNKPTDGQTARVRVLGVTRLVASDNETYGSKIGATTGGQGVMVTSDKDKYYGVCISGNATHATAETSTVLLTGLAYIDV